ncbi:DOMON-like domain-containing protein [Acaryochloris marina]|uniref:DOMON-like domain-containing protein n=1 Tax=Acaryochloris marina TaxID=155978 RepID=UPI0021C2D53E|nr:DOMON-like domain-containing protein [Acaryochloris marina]BDM78492.1 hypothetical protein AM10699_13610 [Acaryochloris marina MBIC10699]
MTAFSLQPFGAPHPDITITGTLEREGNQLAIAYTVSGHLDQVMIPSPSLPTRQFDLWEATCLEFFLGQPHQPHYWEFNLSPAGHWNVFHLEAYRQGLQEVEGITELPFHVHHQQTALTLSLTFDLNQIMVASPTLGVGICAVIQSHEQSLTYWALCHPGSEADFHRRDSFILGL